MSIKQQLTDDEIRRVLYDNHWWFREYFLSVSEDSFSKDKEGQAARKRLLRIAQDLFREKLEQSDELFENVYTFEHEPRSDNEKRWFFDKIMREFITSDGIKERLVRLYPEYENPKE